MSAPAALLSGLLGAILLTIFGVRHLLPYWMALRIRRRAEKRMGYLRSPR